MSTWNFRFCDHDFKMLIFIFMNCILMVFRNFVVHIMTINYKNDFSNEKLIGKLQFKFPRTRNFLYGNVALSLIVNKFLAKRAKCSHLYVDCMRARHFMLSIQIVNKQILDLESFSPKSMNNVLRYFL